MTSVTASPASTGMSAHWKAAWAALILLALTSVHHAYGAAIYGTPWRLHILGIALPVALLIGALIYVRQRTSGSVLRRLATWLAAVAILVFPVGVIGLFEGGYNHLLKDIVYFGMGAESTRAWFPPPTYEMPNDLLFELTGVAQFPLAVIAAVLTVSMLRRGDE